MYKHKEKTILKGIPGVRMWLIGKISEVDLEQLENDLEYDEELKTGVIHTNDITLMNGYFYDDDKQQWIAIREGKCSGSFDHYYNSLDALLDVETRWKKVHSFVENDSKNRKPLELSGFNILEEYRAFLQGFKKAVHITNYRDLIYVIEMDDSKKYPISCSALNYRNGEFTLDSVWVTEESQ